MIFGPSLCQALLTRRSGNSVRVFVCFRYTKGGSLDGRYSGLSPNPHGPGLLAPGLTSLHLGPAWPGGPPSHDVPPHGHQPGPPGCGGRGDMIVITSMADCHTGCHTRDSAHRDNHLIGQKRSVKAISLADNPRSYTDCH